MPTSFEQNLRFRHVPEERIDEFNFIGGLVTDAHETKLEPNQSPDLANTIFNDTGSIKTRNGYTRYNDDAVGATSDEANTGASTGTITLDAVGDYAAQTFQVGTNASFVQVNFYLAMANSGEEQLMRAELWSGGTGPSALLNQGQILLVSGTAETAYTFRFRLPHSLTSATEYAVVLRPFIRGSTQSVNSVLVHRTGNSYANGGAYTSTDSGLSWSAVSNVDLKFDVLTGGATGGTGLIRYYSDTGIKQFIAKIGTTLYRGNDSTGVMTAITLGSGISLTAANVIDWTVTNNTLLVVDDDHRIQKYRGSTNANYSTGTLSVTNGDATVTGSGTAWNTITNVEAGEYIQLPDSKWYKIISVASDTSLEIEIDYQGATLAGQSYVISPWGEVQGKLSSATVPSGLVRPEPKSIENHIDRIWTLDGNMLRFSVLDTSINEEHFNDWDSANNAGAIIIPSGKGDVGTALYSLNGVLYVFQRNAIWGVYGNSPGNFELRNISNEVGLIDKRTLVEYDRYLMFKSAKGIQIFDGANLKNISEGVVNTFIESWSNQTSPVAMLWGNRYVIAYTPSGGSFNSEALFYDIPRGVFGKLEGLYVSGWSNWNGGNDTGQIYFVSSNQGSIYRWDIGGNDDGYEIETRYDTGSLGFGQGVNDKTMKKVYLQQIAGGDWTMTTTMTTDVDFTTTTSTIDLDTGESSLWDVSLWDDGLWSPEGRLNTTRIAEFQGLAKYFRFTFSQIGYDEGIEILGMTVSARIRRLT